MPSRSMRDEIALKVHLGKAEAKEEWEKISAKLDDLLQDYEPLKKAVGETSDNMWTALKLVAEEVQHGFERIRKSL